MSENAAEVLGRHFEHVAQRDVETRATFADHAAASAYLATFSPELARSLPHFEGPRTYAGHTAVLIGALTPLSRRTPSADHG